MVTTLDCKKKTSTSPNSRERPLIRKTGWGTTDKFYEKEDKSLLDVENVETTGERCCDLS